MPQMGKQSKNNLKKEEVSTASGETEPSLHRLGELEMGQQRGAGKSKLVWEQVSQ